MVNPFKLLTKKEILLLSCSIAIVTIANFFSGTGSIFNLLTVIIGVLAVLFGAKGNVWGQILIAVFSLFYGVISYQFHYWGEMVTYLGMTFPMALWSIYTWVSHPAEENGHEVKINYLSKNQIIILVITGILVTAAFYKILVYLDTPNIWFSTLSVTTTYYAAALTMLRSSYFAFWYALNDIVLIILWVYASIFDKSYIPLVVNFAVFLVNDSYGFYSWKKREKQQGKSF